MIFVLLAVCSIVAGVIAAVAGFGIGSLLTPTMASIVPAKVAVAAVSIPHFVATAYRCWQLRDKVDVRLLKSFGVMSAVGGLAGAVANYFSASHTLEIVLGILLLFVGIGGFFGLTKRLRFEGPWAWIAGAVSGFLGGLVGNQGGLRSGAMTGLGVSRDAFIATATATGLVVDGARMPVYIAGQWQELVRLWPQILWMTIGVVVGTVAGMALLKRIPENIFFRVVSVLLVILGTWLILKP